MEALCKLIDRVKYLFYMTVTYPFEPFHNMRAFRFGIPWMMKMTPRTTSTEADALRFLHAADPTLPIPKLIDSFVAEGRTYTIMSKIPGELFIEVQKRISKEEIFVVCEEVLEVMKKLWKSIVENCCASRWEKIRK